jgi:hypothetical protein
VTTQSKGGHTPRTRRHCCIPVLSLMLCAGVAPAASAYSEAVALVTEISGATTPALSVHREVAPGTRIVLGPGAHVSLLHYGSCTIVTLKGGTATVTDKGVEADAADIESMKPGPCPKVHKIPREELRPLGGVVVTRGRSRPSFDIAPDALVVLRGAAAADAVVVETLDNNRNPVGSRVAVQNRSFKLDGSFQPKRSYLLKISFSGGSEPIEVPIAISPSPSGALLIFELD